MSTPVGAVQGQNAHRGVKRSVQGNPVGVPMQLPGFRGRAVDAGGAVRAPKPRNGNLNNETSNIRIPYNRVCPLEMLSSYQGRVGPGDILFNYKYPPGFTKSRPMANNATLGVNTLARVVGLDGLNRMLMGSSPNGWRIGENVLHDPVGIGPYSVLAGTDGVFALTTLNEYRLDGVVISNDEPGAFTSSGSRDNAIFNIAIQGPTETNNGFLMYEDPTKSNTALFNPLSGVTNMRTVEAHARGSAESGMHIENTPMPGKVGSEFQRSRGKVDFVANYCGTYAMYPSQMFDRRVESLNTLYVGLRAYELSLESKKQVTTETGEKYFEGKSDAFIEEEKMYFYQYLPFSSRVATVIQEVTDVHFKMAKEALLQQSGGTVVPTDAQVRESMASVYGVTKGRAKAAMKVGAIKQQTATSLPSAHFDTATYDPIRSEDMWNMVGAWKLGRVMDTKAAVHERYAGGPRDTSFSCIVDVQIAWCAALGVTVSPDTKAPSTGFLLDPSERSERSGQQSATTLANNLSPPLRKVIGTDFGRDVAPPQEDGGRDLSGGVMQSIRELLQDETVSEQQRQNQLMEEENKRLAAAAGVYGQVPASSFQAYKDEAAEFVRGALGAEPKALEVLAESEFGVNPMVKMRQIISGGQYTWNLIPRVSTEDWAAFVQRKEELRTMIASGGTGSRVDILRASVKELEKKWQAMARNELSLILENVNELRGDNPGLEGQVIEGITEYEASLLKAKEVIEQQRDAEVDSAKQLAYERELGKLLNRTHHFINLFGVALQSLGVRSRWQRGFRLENQQESTDRAIADAKLFHRNLHFSAMCELHAKYVLVDDPRLDARAPAPAPAPAPAARTGASAAAAAAAAPRPAGRARGKSPARPRPGGAVVATGTAPPAPTAPAASPAPAGVVPAAAAGMSSTPLVPTQAAAGEAAAPRRRAREAGGAGGESVTNSLFNDMFKSAPTGTDASADEPASPTPSSGSEGPSAGPRVFRRQR